MDIGFAGKAIRSCLEEKTPKRTRRAERGPRKAPARGRGGGDPKPAGALGEHTGCVAELSYYPKAPGRNRGTNNN